MSGLDVASGAIDCDVHVAPESFDALTPHLSEFWKEYIAEAAIQVTGNRTAYPPGARTSASAAARSHPGPAVPSTHAALEERVLERTQPRRAILNCLTLFDVHRNPYYTAAVASALNDWMRAEFLDRDDRLRASLVVSTLDPDDAVSEIERLGDDPRFVQVLLPVRSDVPWGNKRNHRIYEAALAHDMQVGLHAWGRAGRAMSPSGFTPTYLEDYVSNQAIAQAQILSFVAEGVFDRLPELRVTLMECGFAWLPPLLWRFDKDWRGVWREVPWLKEKPSEYVRRHFRATTNPAFVPADRARHVRELLDMVGSDWLLYASDYPHDHGQGFATVYELLDDDAREQVMRGNAEAQLSLS